MSRWQDAINLYRDSITSYADEVREFLYDNFEFNEADPEVVRVERLELDYLAGMSLLERMEPDASSVDYDLHVEQLRLEFGRVWEALESIYSENGGLL